MNKKYDKKAPAATGACQIAQQCKLNVNCSRWVHRSEYGWNVFYGEKLIGSFIGIEPADAFANELVTS